MTQPDNLVGGLLVAAPTMTDPNFVRTVVLVLDHGDHGSLGVVLNRSTGVSVAAILPGWSSVVGENSVIYRGGPVGRDSVLALAAMRVDDHETVTGPVRRVSADFAMVDLDSDPTDIADGVRMRLFTGYAGWSPGQLQAELDDDAWIVVPADESDPFSSMDEELWSQVLRRQPYPLSLVASFPVDPTLN